MVIVITFNLPHHACGQVGLGECPGALHSEREGRACPPSARRPSSARGLDLLFPTAGAEHMCTAIPYQVYGFLEA